MGWHAPRSIVPSDSATIVPVPDSLSGENLTPPAGVGGGDPPAAAKVLAGGDAAVHWLCRQAANQLALPETASSPCASMFAVCFSSGIR